MITDWPFRLNKAFYFIYLFNCGRNVVFTGESQKALYYMKLTQPTMQEFNDIKLHLSVLLANG